MKKIREFYGKILVISGNLDEINVEDYLSYSRCILMTLRNLVEIYDWNNFMLGFIIHGDIVGNCLHPWQITSMGFKFSFPKHVENKCVIVIFGCSSSKTS